MPQNENEERFERIWLGAEDYCLMLPRGYDVSDKVVSAMFNYMVSNGARRLIVSPDELQHLISRTQHMMH